MKKTYIASPEYLTSMYSNPQFHGRWVVVTKVPIEKIRIDKSLFSFQNEVNWNDVEYMSQNFEPGAWFPIFVNPDFFLLDGQHRLAAAKRMKLKYIDVVIDNGEQPCPNRNNYRQNETTKITSKSMGTFDPSKPNRNNND